jgi:hypothetical protein
VEANRLRAAVVWGGGIHYFFQEDWLRESTNAESYLMDHDIARCRLFGVASIAELCKPWAEMSLKDQGWLDKPSCPMLLVNGKADLQTPIADLYLLLEHGAPKSARVFPGGHMGQTPQTFPVIVDWLKKELSERTIRRRFNAVDGPEYRKMMSKIERCIGASRTYFPG